jgi:hypothetical protein
MDADSVQKALAEIDRQIEEGQENIAILRELIAALKRDGDDARRAEGLVQEALDVQDVLRQQRRQFLDRVAH